MSHTEIQRPRFSVEQAAELARRLYGLDATPTCLPSERDQNFRLDGGGERFVLKISRAGEDERLLDLQDAALARVAARDPSLRCPRILPSRDGRRIEEVEASDGRRHRARLFSWLPGVPLAEIRLQSPALLRELGRVLGRLDVALHGFLHDGAPDGFYWDLQHAGRTVREHMGYVRDAAGRSRVERCLERFEREVAPRLPELRAGVIHNDGNDYNVIVSRSGDSGPWTVGLIDFGDMVDSYLVCEAAVAAAYAALGKRDPLGAIAHLVRGYHRANPLRGDELAVLHDLVCMRLCVSVSLSAYRKTLAPDNEYLAISERPAWRLLERLAGADPGAATERLARACGLTLRPAPRPVARRSRDALIAARRRHLGPSLSLHFATPLKIVRGRGPYLYEENGRRYLDAVNNVCHVGHCHPHVVAAGRRQMAVLNTNTRYLHDGLVEYAERLCATFPDPLSVCYLVCSGSEANELALRLARAFSGRRGVVTVDGGYHGNTQALIDVSPYKFAGSGGAGAPSWVRTVPMPDVFRGRHRAAGAAAGELYARHVAEAVADGTAGAYICESLLGCGGQVVLPDGYLEHAYRHVRAAGAVCIADEVQVGFGRVGSDFWAFETQDVVPDIVTLGKPIGNGHPLAAVITTRAIADAFANGMEYFNTFGGNPVSCAIGMAVLDVIEGERLQQNAREVGDYLLGELTALMPRHELIGDVRGLGLFVGLELVRSRETLEPADAEAAAVVEGMKDRGVLVGIDGPLHNVLKLKPPLVFSRGNAAYLVEALDDVLASLGGAPSRRRSPPA